MVNEVINAIADTLDVKAAEIIADKKLYDSIGVDSTEMVEVCVGLGKKFSIKIAANEISKYSTPVEIAALVEKKKQEMQRL